MASTVKTCSVVGCNGNASTDAQGARGFCRAHYSRWRRYGDPTAGRAAPGGPPRFCSIQGCGDEQRGHGLCNRHYLRFRQYGDPLGGVHDRHGMAHSRLYNIWKGMRSRCGHKKGCSAHDAKNYRDKGIRVCDAWQKFRPFAEWASANGYADNLTIDRINSDLGYEPANCRWATALENGRTAKHRKLTADDAREIRRLVSGGASSESLSARYKVSARYIRRVTSGRAWAEQEYVPPS